MVEDFPQPISFVTGVAGLVYSVKAYKRFSQMLLHGEN